MFTLGLLSWMYHRPTEGTIRFLERQFRRKPEIAAANIAAFRAGYNYGETTEAFAVSYEIKPAPMAPGTLPQHLRQPGARATASSPPGSAPGCRSSSAPTRSPRRRTSCTSCPSTSPSASAPSRPRTRSPASARRSGASFGGALGRHDDVRPGHLAEVRGHRPGGHDRAAAGHRRRAARRPVHRACRPRPSSPTCCRPCSAATARRRSRSSRPAPPATASTRPWRPPGSR